MDSSSGRGLPGRGLPGSALVSVLQLLGRVQPYPEEKDVPSLL